MEVIRKPYDCPAYILNILCRLLTLPVQLLHLVLTLPAVFCRSRNLSIFKAVFLRAIPKVHREQRQGNFKAFCYLVYSDNRIVFLQNLFLFRQFFSNQHKYFFLFRCHSGFSCLRIQFAQNLIYQHDFLCLVQITEKHIVT